MRRTWGAYRRKNSARASGCPLSQAVDETVRQFLYCLPPG